MPTATETAIEAARKLRKEIKELGYEVDEKYDEIRRYYHREEEQGYDGEDDIIGKLRAKWNELNATQDAKREELRELERKHELEYDHGEYMYGDDVCEEE